MNFSLQRCIQLLRLQFVTDRKIYGYGTLALFAIQLSVLLYYTYSNSDGLYFDKQKELAEQGLLIFNFMTAAWCFKSLHGRSTRLQALMLPVTVMERLAVGVFFTVVLFPVVYLLTYLASGGIAHYIDSQVLQSGNRFYYFNRIGGIGWGFLMANLVFVLIGLAGSAVFRKLAIAKSIVSLAILFVFINFGNDILGMLLLDNKPLTESMREPMKDGRTPDRKSWETHSPFSSWRFTTSDKDGQFLRTYEMKVPEYLNWIENITGYLMLLALPYLTVLKLREQELS